DLISRPGPRTVLVVGAGLAGLRTAAELRARGFSGNLTVVGAEEHLPYDRPPLSKELLSRDAPVWLADDLGADLPALADTLVLGRRVTGLVADDAGAQVTTDGPGTPRLGADVVVLAGGAEAVRPPGWDSALVLRTLEEAARLRPRLVPGARVVVVGAGWIGAEVAGVAAAAGCAVTVVEAATAPLSRELGTEVGALTERWYAAAGVDLRLGTAVEQVTDEGVRVGGPRTAPGSDTLVPADVVVAAVGSRPATRWLAGALPLTARGTVPVDERGRVLGGPASVRAVGDCADLTLPDGRTVPGGHWDGALQHPAALAADLLGQEVPAPPAPYVFSTQLGHDLTLVGHPSPTAQVVLRGDPLGAAGWTALYLERPDAEVGPGETVLPAPAAGPFRLAAGLTVDRPRDVGALRRLLAGGGRPPVDTSVLTDPAVPLRRAVRAPG
ncbi:FAD-dependent oxidoreductase, partial [Georgenia sp. 10Sc9-8]|nr:FAD-dependent oxidoreductase [Georgenia halotolerans]